MAVGVDHDLGDREHGVGHGDVDVLALPGALGVPQRGEDAERGEQSRNGISHTGSHPDGVRGVGPGDGHQTAHGLRDDVEGRPVPVGAVPARLVAEAANRGVDQAGIAGREGVVVETEAVHDAGGEVLDDDVGVVDQAQQYVAGLGLLQVQHERPLVAIGRLEHPAVVAGFVVGGERAGVAEEVAARRLHLDHVGALVGEQRRAERPGEGLGEVDDPHPVEGAAGSGVHAVASRPSSARPMTTFWICGVPSPISRPKTSRSMACSGSSSAKPLWPWATMQSRMVCSETSVA